MRDYKIGMVETVDLNIVGTSSGGILSIGRKNAKDFFVKGSKIDKNLFVISDMMMNSSISWINADIKLVAIAKNGARLWDLAEPYDGFIDRIQRQQKLTDAQIAAEVARIAARNAEIEAQKQADAAIAAQRQAALEAAQQKAKLEAQQKAAAEYAAMVARLEQDGNQWLPENAYFGEIYPQGKSYGQQCLKLLKGEM